MGAGEPAVLRAGEACVAVHAGRERVRAMTRAAFPKRRARLVFVRSEGELLRTLRAELVDAVLVDVGSTTDDAWAALTLARSFPSAPFFAVVPLRASEGAVPARAVELGAAGVLVDGIDDAAVRELLLPALFRVRFAGAFDAAPPPFGLTSALQHAAWSHAVACAGRLARTEELARALGVTREHLSRSFGPATPALKQIVDFVRVAVAAELSRNPGHRVRDIAGVLGFASSSHLARACARVVGTPPSALADASGPDLVARFLAQQTRADTSQPAGEARRGHPTLSAAATGAAAARTASPFTCRSR